MSVKFLLINILIVINSFAFFINLADKQAAIHKKRRIPEATLWLFGFLGGACGSYVSMRLFHHKTKHKNFMIIMPLLALIQIGLTIFTFKEWL